jgi:hypothetical protein
MLLQLWHRITLPETGRTFKSLKPWHRAIQCYPKRVFIRVSPIFPSWHEMLYNCTRSRTGENISERFTYPSIALAINDHSRSTHTDTRMDSCTDWQTDKRRSVIALGGGSDNRALQAKFDSRNRNIFLACNIQNNLRGSTRAAIRFVRGNFKLNGGRCGSITVVFATIGIRLTF